MNDNIAISVIVPVHNVEEFAHRCASSLFSQTLKEGIEFIFVDDCSTDHSVEIIQKVLLHHPERIPYTRILHHKENLGSAHTRTTGLSCATGEYVAFCDADDWVEETMYATLLKGAREVDADMVMCDYVEEYWGRKILRKQPNVHEKEDYLRQLMLGKASNVVWNRLIRRTIFTEKKVKFEEGINMYEDVLLSISLAMATEVLKYVPQSLYHYNRENPNSYTVKITSQSAREMEKAISLLEKKGFEEDSSGIVLKMLPYKILTAKLNVLSYGEDEVKREWSRKYSEYDSFILSHKGIHPFWKMALKMNAHHGLRSFRRMWHIWRFLS